MLSATQEVPKFDDFRIVPESPTAYQRVRLTENIDRKFLVVPLFNRVQDVPEFVVLSIVPKSPTANATRFWTSGVAATPGDRGGCRYSVSLSHRLKF